MRGGEGRGSDRRYSSCSSNKEVCIVFNSLESTKDSSLLGNTIQYISCNQVKKAIHKGGFYKLLTFDLVHDELSLNSAQLDVVELGSDLVSHANSSGSHDKRLDES